MASIDAEKRVVMCSWRDACRPVSLVAAVTSTDRKVQAPLEEGMASSFTRPAARYDLLRRASCCGVCFGVTNCVRYRLFLVSSVRQLRRLHRLLYRLLRPSQIHGRPQVLQRLAHQQVADVSNTLPPGPLSSGYAVVTDVIMRCVWW